MWTLVQTQSITSTYTFPPSLTCRRLTRSANSAIANQESLSGLETEMRKLEGIVKEITEELGYLERREERFSNTNRTSRLPVAPRTHEVLTTSLVSTNQRVQNFAWFSLFSLTGLGIWQIFHLRAFFKRKYLID